MTSQIHRVAAMHGETIVIDLADDDVIRGAQIFKLGEDVKHPVKDFTVDEEFVASLFESYEKITAAGFRIPILVEHKTDGRIYGEVLDLYREGERILIDMEMADGIKSEWERGYRRHLSPGLWPERIHPHTGETLKNVLREVSMVSVPHLKNLTPPEMPHYSMHESGFLQAAEPHNEGANMADEKAPAETVESAEEEEDMGAMMAAMLERLDALEARMQEMEPGEEEEPEGEGAEMSEQDRRIADLESKLALSEVSFDFPDASDADRLELAEIKMVSERQYKQIVKHRKASKEVGSVGMAEVSTSVDYAFAKAKARAAGCAAGRETFEYIQKNYPNVLT